ncbi:multiple sugar transport system permease protein [Kribbella aluminosa]|uniref:Multiple sugar transport system permease protein n=1 Tax=Kribbella aluminosa TaxID=416017 RepID=A0ABS4UWU5_9ACTN|nr:carbohydrate ABC transporter permease [Kribbella aluminosa]MBP2356127.1 multiple sugar transport system permease protein [Kribbella aluminosa]
MTAVTSGSSWRGTTFAVAVGRRRGGALALRYLLLVTILVVTVLPLFWMIVTSFRSTGENLYGSTSVLPRHPSLGAYRALFDRIPVVAYIANTLFVAVLSIGSQCLFSALGGYALSRRYWPGRRLVFLLLIASIMFPFEAIMVSLFVMVNSLGLIDNLIGVWLPMFVTPVNIMVMRAAFLAVPDELEEAAVLDGANEWTRFTHVFLPAAKGALTFVALMTFISSWDEFLWPLLVLRQDAHFTLTLGLAQLATTQLGNDERVVMAGAVVSIVPILVVFGLLQRHFYRGVGQGGLKI